jgi:hypothetical protein
MLAQKHSPNFFGRGTFFAAVSDQSSCCGEVSFNIGTYFPEQFS